MIASSVHLSLSRYKYRTLHNIHYANLVCGLSLAYVLFATIVRLHLKQLLLLEI
ncbi:hypothetical protein RP300_01024 [Oligella urethralis]|nr:hypothetical protein RP300_01024 [Oligella urethralis]